MLCTLTLQIVLPFLWHLGYAQAKVKDGNAVAEEGNIVLNKSPLYTLKCEDIPQYAAFLFRILTVDICHIATIREATFYP